MTTWSFYDKETGLFDGSTYGCDHDKFVEANARGRGFVEGRFDPLSQRVNVDTGKVVDYIPDQPGSDHEWDGTAKRWRLNPEVQASLDAQAVALAAIEESEKLSGPRAVREALLVLLPAGPERDRLSAIEDQIKASRALLLPQERKTI